MAVLLPLLVPNSTFLNSGWLLLPTIRTPVFPSSVTIATVGISVLILVAPVWKLISDVIPRRKSSGLLSNNNVTSNEVTLLFLIALGEILDTTALKRLSGKASTLIVASWPVSILPMSLSGTFAIISRPWESLTIDELVAPPSLDEEAEVVGVTNAPGTAYLLVITPVSYTHLTLPTICSV